jgi:hypothetical protein
MRTIQRYKHNVWAECSFIMLKQVVCNMVVYAVGGGKPRHIFAFTVTN